MLKLSRQPYYRWLADPITPSEVVEAYRANATFDAHRDDPEFGHRLLADEARDTGERGNPADRERFFCSARPALITANANQKTPLFGLQRR
ncbi:hypothetical protein [uncultured Arthrobacter sp.]|uniref:hypothetical protein n=1 Tax=uncultured Arthrobacter sp. TaxID=114050 RepID=UPI002633BD23|nr:hypothetical protein [uncultured Arthrobacter sp.]